MIMDFNEFCRQIHSKLSITTSSGDFEGVLKFVSEKGQRVTFEHVYELPRREYLGSMHILFPSIFSWKIIGVADDNFEFSNFNSADKLVSGEFSIKERIDFSDIVEIPPDKHFVEYLPAHLKNKCPSDFCIIDTIDQGFFKALKQLSDSAVIGVSVHGPKISRDGILTWLCLSTTACVYLFDIEKLGESAFKEGLKEILEAEKHQKVIHDCREVTDCLVHLFNININCIFDTQVADYLINMQMCTGKRIFKCVNSLDSCLFKYLKVPQQFLYTHNKSALLEDEINFYQNRPVSSDFLNVLIKSAMYLPYLKEEQENLLMSPYAQAVEMYLDSARSASDSEVRLMLSEPSYSVPSCLLDSLKQIRFYDFPQPKNEFVQQRKNLSKNSVSLPHEV